MCFLSLEVALGVWCGGLMLVATLRLIELVRKATGLDKKVKE